MWLGPARGMPYSHGIAGNCGEWGHMSNFSLGWIPTWGIHHVDIAPWGNDAGANRMLSRAWRSSWPL